MRKARRPAAAALQAEGYNDAGRVALSQMAG